MPAACAADLREELLARVWAPSLRSAARQDAELAELEALDAAGALVPPDDEEPYGPFIDPASGPPSGIDEWLADLPSELLDEYLAATEGPPVREPIVAGRLPRQVGNGGGFAAGGVADELPPGPVLAGFAGDAWAAGLGRLGDDELIGVLRAARRLASWSAALELAAVADLAARREAEAAAAGDCGPGEHIGDEIAAALTLTGRAADALLDLALALRRLPATMAALADGRIDRYKAAVIAEEVGGLGGEHAAAVERQVLAHAPDQTTGQLRASTRRAVLTADPAAARERKERAQRDARVERWDEHAGTAALAGRDLPPAEVLAADRNLSSLAAALSRAGVNGTMDQLRAQVYLALLTGQPIAALTASAAPAESGHSNAGSYPGTGSTASGHAPGVCTPGLHGSVNLTVPLATWLGLSDAPGHAAGFGPLDAGDSRDLATLLARHPGSRWCVTVTGAGGRPLAHGCARSGPGPSGGSRPPPRHRPTRRAARRRAATPDVTGWLAGIAISRLEAGDCRHLRESPAYRPPPSLRHLITIRQPACSFPGCRRPAGRCDQDHTIPYDLGGRTCECNLAPLCRRHHRAKQAHGWKLVQPEPGMMAWTTPSGRTYTTRPSAYPE
ncbi:MAG TPA: DUF222 domain-containing protein [Streptosporangiaceae bacterium]|nr:DUF222 domain-containing protein [Streptosporangiaceae bacterium]